jgi:hypothetical protein
MKRSLWTVSLALVVGAIALVASAEEKNAEKVALDKVPAVVLDAAKKAVQGIEVKNAAKETIGDKVEFKLEGKVAGKEAEVVVSAEGKVLEVEQEIELKDVPALVTEAALKAVAGFKAEDATKGLEGDVAFFALEGKADGKKIAVKLAADGKVLEIEQSVNVKDVPEAVQAAAANAVKGIAIKKAVKVTEGTVIVYELTGKAGDKSCDLKVSAEGKVLGVEQEAENEKNDEAEDGNKDDNDNEEQEGN